MRTSERHFSGLAAWFPRLLRTWRRHLAPGRQTGPADRLTPAEAERVATGVRRLSAGLTGERALVGERYLSDPDLLGAYLLYFWPLSYLQAGSALSGLAQAPRSLLDLGSGPGPMAAAGVDLGARQITLADRSREALRLAEELFKSAGVAPQTHCWDPDRADALPGGRFDLILLGHVLNELWPDQPDRGPRRARLVAELKDLLAPGGHLLVIEPALTVTSRDLLTVRDLLVTQGFTVIAPCLWQGACPALVKPNETCHSELAWSPDPWLLDLIRRAGFQKRSIKWTGLLLAPPGASGAAAPDPEWLRIVSDPLRSKNGRVRLLACGPAGRLSLGMKPEQADPGNRVFFSLRRGDLVRLHGAQPRTGGGLDLGPGARLERVRRAG